MAPIEVHTDEPINASQSSPPAPTQTSSGGQATTAAKADNASHPMTAAPDGPPLNRYAPAAPTSTYTQPTSTSSYAPAQPASAAFPAPTGSVGGFPTGPTPLQSYSAPTQTYPPPPTSTSASAGPPPPQPGAVPVPQFQSDRAHSRSPIPPPPKAGEGPRVIQPGPAPTARPNQNYMPPTAASAYSSAQIDTSAPPNTLAHPPGYVQNPVTIGSAVPSQPTSNSSGNILPVGPGGSGGLGGPGAGSFSSGSEPSTQEVMDNISASASQAWDTAKKWGWAAAGKLGEAEAEVWRRVNGEK